MATYEEIIAGLTLLAFSAALQLVCLLLMRVLVKLKHGGHVSTLRTWLYLASALEQVSFIIFHIKYHFYTADLHESESCIVIRFLQSFSSTFTTMWLLVISCFYFMITIKPEKCFTFHSRFFIALCHVDVVLRELSFIPGTSIPSERTSTLGLH